MNLFEYLTVAISIVLSMSIVRSLESLGDVVDPARRDPLHLAWFSLKTLQPALMWWSIWGLNDQTEWNFLAFLLCLLGPIFLFLQITTLTTRVPEDVSDWASHFMSIKRRFFTAGLGVAVTGPALLATLGDRSAALTLLAGITGEVFVALIGARTENRKIHYALVLVVVLTFAFWGTALFQPLTRTP